MAEVKKRPSIPEGMIDKNPEMIEEPRKPMTIHIGENEYRVPVLSVKQYKKIVKYCDEQSDKGILTETDNLEYVLGYLYLLLHDAYPEVTREALEEMPMWQAGKEFFLQLHDEVYRPPLA